MRFGRCIGRCMPGPTRRGRENGLSTPMRLAVHAMNATLILVWLPLGAAAMAYSLVKGEDIRVSGRLMAVTGTFLAFAQSPWTPTIATAVAGTLH